MTESRIALVAFLALVVACVAERITGALLTLVRRGQSAQQRRREAGRLRRMEIRGPQERQ